PVVTGTALGHGHVEVVSVFVRHAVKARLFRFPNTATVGAIEDERRVATDGRDRSRSRIEIEVGCRADRSTLAVADRRHRSLDPGKRFGDLALYLGRVG